VSCLAFRHTRTELSWPEQVDPVTRRVNWPSAHSSTSASRSTLYFILNGCIRCGETRSRSSQQLYSSGTVQSGEREIREHELNTFSSCAVNEPHLAALSSANAVASFHGHAVISTTEALTTPRGSRVWNGLHGRPYDRILTTNSFRA